MVKQLFLISLLGSLFFVTSCNAFDRNSDHANAEKILNNPPFEKLTDSIRKFPADPAIYIKRGELLLQQKHADLATLDFAKAWKLQPDESTGLRYAASLFMAGDEEQAIDLLKDCIKKYPANQEFPRRLSEAYLQVGKKQEALEQYNIMLSKDSENFEAWYEKGVILADMEDTGAAILALEKAYWLQPLQLVGISLANLYAETKNPEALVICDNLLKRDTAGELVDPLYVKGVYYSNIGERKLALEQFELCINRDWKFSDAYIEKGIVYFDEKNIDEALKTFMIAASVSNTNADAYFWMGRCYEARGKKQEAISNYYKALALDHRFKEAAAGIERLKEKT